MRTFGVAGLVFAAAMVVGAPTMAQNALIGTVIAGPTAAGVHGSPLIPGRRVQSSASSPTEVAFSDGTSIVLGPDADITIDSVARDEAGRWVLSGSSERGTLRILAADKTAMALHTPAGDLRLAGTSALVQGGANGSVTLLSAGRVEVRHDGRTDVLERSGFRLVFAGGGFERAPAPQLVAAVNQFAPVERPAGTVGRPLQQIGCTLAQNQKGGRHGANQSDAPCSGSKAAFVPSQDQAVTYNSNQSTARGSQSGIGGENNGQSFALARAELSQIISGGSSFAAPGPNSTTTTTDTTGFQFKDPITNQFFNVAQATVSVERTRFGTGRVRRFAPGASGFPPQATRNDSGVVAFSGTNATANFFYQNLATNELAPESTFYDAIANVGSANLTLSLIPTPPGPQAALNFTHFETTLPRIFITDASRRPFLQLGATKDYFGSAVFENAVITPVPVDGRVSALQGDLGRLVFLASGTPDQYFPSPPPEPIDLGTSKTPPGLPPTTDNLSPPPLPVVFIIDKIHTQNVPVDPTNPDIADTRGIAAGERYFIIGGTPIQPVPVSAGLPGAPPGTVARFAISDGVNPQSFDGSGSQSIADQFLNPTSGSRPVAFSQFNAFRPEETFVQGAPRGDTHLLVISSADGRNPAMRTDLQIAADGTSSASTSVGGITNFNGALALSGVTVGGAQLSSLNGQIAITANLGSLGTDATGLGAQMFGGSNRAPGQIGFFGVSQADSRLGAPGTPEGVQPGTLQAVSDPSKTSPFAYTRLATNVGVPLGLAPPGSLNHDGFATGIVQSVAGGQTSLYAISSSRPGDVHIASNPSNTEFAATLGFQPTALGDLSFEVGAAPAPNGASGRKSLNFGNAPGPIPTTSVISTSTFAGVVPSGPAKPGGAAMASVDNDTIQGIANRTGTIAAPGGPVVDANLPPSNEHLAWGFFLGDLAVQATGQQRDYVGMGFWVAGRPMSLQALQALTGTATYAGGMVGTVAQQSGAQAQLRTVTGQFAEKWNFATRSGSMNASFDGGTWNGVGVTMPVGRTDFGGAGISDNGRIMTVQGAFFHNSPVVQTPATPLSAPNTPAAVGGLFGIRGVGYGANGIFVGGRR
jgi:hypothetical protein